MKCYKHIIYFTIVVFAALPSPASAMPAAHDHGSPTELPVQSDVRWPTDAPLRLGMSRIRDAVSRNIGAFEAGRLTVADAETIADSIDENIGYMVQNCKLEPDADASLHQLLGEILAGKTRMTSDPLDSQGLPRITEALEAYPKMFDHPGWSSPRATP